MKITVQRFSAYAKPSGEVCIRVRGVWYGLGLYFERPRRGLHIGRHGIILPSVSVIWRRRVENVSIGGA
ncbi:MAG: hypothetical protein LC798_11890 [Chloroflexi bacterium]|nr:hypothetical protein [Chloroflexota bacterium]